MSEDSGDGCGIRLRHALAFAADIYRSVFTNRQTIAATARRLGLDVMQTEGVFRILRFYEGVPSPERLALVAMRDWGYDDADIAEIFGRSERWAALVRSRADEIRSEEFFPESLEYLDVGLCPGDPSPEELASRVAELRGRGVITGRSPTRRPGIRSYLWNGSAHAFVPIGVE